MDTSRVDGVKAPLHNGTPKSYIGFTVEATDAIATRKPTKDKINAAKKLPPRVDASLGPFMATQQKMRRKSGAER